MQDGPISLDLLPRFINGTSVLGLFDFDFFSQELYVLFPVSNERV